MQNTACPECGGPNLPGAITCQWCGSTLREPGPSRRGRFIGFGLGLVLLGLFLTACSVLGYFSTVSSGPPDQLPAAGILVACSVLLVLAPGIVLLTVGLRSK
jgi:hypothetical protein